MSLQGALEDFKRCVFGLARQEQCDMQVWSWSRRKVSVFVHTEGLEDHRSALDFLVLSEETAEADPSPLLFALRTP